MDPSMDVERPRLIGDIVLEKIRDAIIERRLTPGSRLSEASLATMLQVSKTPVREALLRLRTIGLVTAEEGALHVVLPSPDLVRQAYEVRAGLEAMTAELAANRASAEAVDAIGEAARESNVSAQSGDTSGFRAEDRRFHELVASASANALASEQVMNARDLCQALRQRDVMTDQVSRACGEAHIEIADAIRGGAVQPARTLMAEHIYYVMDRVLGSLEPVTDTDTGTVSSS